MQQNSEALDLSQALGIIRRRAPLILLCVLVVAGAAYAFSKQQTKQYTATASVVFRSNPLSQLGLLPDSVSEADQKGAGGAELVGLGDVAAKTARNLGISERKVSSSIDISGEKESSIVGISATASSPVLAARLATTYAHTFVKGQQGASRNYTHSVLALVNKQLAELPASQRFGAIAVSLQNRAQTLRLLEGLKSGDVQLAQVATIPLSPSSPNTAKNTLIGGILGLLLGLGLAFLLERVYRNRLIGDPDDLDEIYHLPLLGTVPNSAAIAQSGRRDGGKPGGLTPEEVEAFNLIRARLRFLSEAKRDLQLVLVASSARGEGATTVARGLAEAAARVGSRTLLLELDLRTPTLAQELNLQSGPGLADVLTGIVSIDETTQSVGLEKVEPGSTPSRWAMDVLPAGSVLPLNPGELIESTAMETTLEYARHVYDLVVVDTSPLTTVSDAFPMLGRVDGVLVVSRVGRSRRDQAEQLHRTLASSGAVQLGVVANGVKSGTPGAYVLPDRIVDSPQAGMPTVVPPRGVPNRP